MAVALVAFLIFFVSARGWRDPAEFFFRGEGRLEQLLASPTATSKYFLASILLMVPVALFFLSIRHAVGGGARMGRIAGWAAVASILAFVVYNLAAGQRRYVIVMVGALALYYYLRRGRRPSALTLVRHGLGGPDGRVRRPGPAARPRPTTRTPTRFSGCPGTRWTHLFETQDTGVAPALGDGDARRAQRAGLHLWQDDPARARS